MSYQALGEIDPWNIMIGHLWSNSDVYVLRFKVTNADIATRGDLSIFADAFGRLEGPSSGVGLDVRGAGIWQATDGAVWVDIVSTTQESFGLNVWQDNAEQMAQKIQNDANVRSRYPNISISDAVFGRIMPPSDAILHWQAQPIVWSHLLEKQTRTTNTPGNGLTDSFIHPADYNFVKGKADDGPKAVPFKEANPFFDNKKDDKKDDKQNVRTTTYFVGGIVAGFLGWSLLSKSQERQKR